MARAEPERTFLLALIQRWRLNDRESYYVPLHDQYQVTKHGKRFSVKRPFDGIFMDKGRATAIEAKYVKGTSFSVLRWVRDQEHQADALWRVARSGNDAILAIRFQPAGRPSVERLVNIDTLVREVGGRLVATTQRIEA